MGTSKIRIDATTLRAMNRLFGIIGLLLGLAFLFVGGFWIHHQHLDSFLQLIAKSESAIGQVVANRPVTVYPSPSSRSLSYTAYQAVVRFTDHNGQAITFTDKLGFARPSFSVGHQVRIFYDPRNAQHAMIDRGWKNFVIPGICLIFGGLIVLGSIQRLIGSAQSFSEFLLLPPFCLRPLLFLPFQFLLAFLKGDAQESPRNSGSILPSLRGVAYQHGSRKSTSIHVLLRVLLQLGSLAWSLNANLDMNPVRP